MPSPVREVQIRHPECRTVKLGRRPPVARCPRLALANYLRPSLPDPPGTLDYGAAAGDVISRVYLNDRYGDCVIACMAHVTGVLTANAGGPAVTFTDQQILDLYAAIGGYVPGDPSTDQGCNEQDALNYWQQKGAPAGSHKITAWLAVDPKSPRQYRTALWLFGNLVYGIGLPDSWLADPRPGFVWDADAPDPNNGHCVAGVGYDGRGVHVATWGFTGAITDAAHARDVDELYVVLSPDVIARASGKAPSGIDWTQLIADFDAIGGSVPPPAPGPGPQPAPPPATVGRLDFRKRPVRKGTPVYFVAKQDIPAAVIDLVVEPGTEAAAGEQDRVEVEAVE